MSRSTGVHLFDSATLEPVEFAETAPSSIIRFSPDGRQLAMAVNEWVPEGPPRLDEQPIQLYDLPQGTLSPHQPGGMAPESGVEYAMEYSDDGRRLAAVVQHYDSDAGHWTGLGTATVWDLAHPARPVFGLTVPEYAAVALSPEGSRLYVAMKGKHSVRAFDVDSGRLLASADDLLRHTHSNWAASTSAPTGRRSPSPARTASSGWTRRPCVDVARTCTAPTWPKAAATRTTAACWQPPRAMTA